MYGIFTDPECPWHIVKMIGESQVAVLDVQTGSIIVRAPTSHELAIAFGITRRPMGDTLPVPVEGDQTDV